MNDISIEFPFRFYIIMILTAGKRYDIMKSMTIRGLNDSLAEKLKQTAKQEGKSVNQLVIETLRKKFNMEKEKKFTKIHHDLDHLFGKWSQEEFEFIQDKIDSIRQIDEELWK